MSAPAILQGLLQASLPEHEFLHIKSVLQPIKHLEYRGVDKTQKECSAINTATFGQKVSLLNKTLSA